MRNSGATVTTALSLALAACAGQAADPPVGTPEGIPTTTVGAPATTGGGGPGTTSTTATSGADDVGGVTVTVGGVTYDLSLDARMPGRDIELTTVCEPDASGTGLFSVVAAVTEENGELATNPQIGLSLHMFASADAAAAFDQPFARFHLTVRHPDDAPGQDLTYTYADDEVLGFEGVTFDGDVGSWIIDGNRISGEVAVCESHSEAFTTASFDITCPTP